jgi:serine protease DegS
MPNSNFRRNALFLAGSVLTGLAIALLATRLWPQLVHRAPVPIATPGAAVEAAPQARPPDALAPPLLAQPMGIGTPPVERTGTGTTAVDTAANTDPPGAIAGSFATAVRASAPAVVSIYTRRVDEARTPLEMLGRRRVQDNLGSGVIVDHQGHIVTNNHVTSQAIDITVQLADGRITNATLVGSDPDTDLAVLQIDLRPLPVMQLGRSDHVAVGDIVLAIGNPFGQLAQTVTHGIVSATGRADLGVATYEDFIQTDAPINEGNSGGALVNTRGQLIGINTAVLGKEQGAEGLGIAIPVDLVRGVMTEILQHGRVIRGWIGIEPADATSRDARDYGLPHAGVAAIRLYPGSPADEAGLLRGDMIHSVDGQEVKSAQDLRVRIARRPPGSRVRLVVDRDDRRLQFEMRVSEAPRQRPQ